MASPPFITHAFAGNPLDRASDRRGDAAWLSSALEAPGARALVFWKGQPLLKSGPELVFIDGALAAKLSETEEHLLFLGLDGDPQRNSLRLLPSGPDRVGEDYARRQPPSLISRAAGPSASDPVRPRRH